MIQSLLFVTARCTLSIKDWNRSVLNIQWLENAWHLPHLSLCWIVIRLSECGTVGPLCPSGPVSVWSGCHTYAQCCSAGSVSALELWPLPRGLCNPPHAARVMRFRAIWQERLNPSRIRRGHPRTDQAFRDTDEGQIMWIWKSHFPLNQHGNVSIFFFLLSNTEPFLTSLLGFFYISPLNSRWICWKIQVGMWTRIYLKITGWFI